MKSTPPSVVSIGGKAITIRIDPKLEAWGEYHADDAEIVLAARTLERKSTLRETLRHEMIHAALDICGISYLERYEEESIIRCLENVFFPAWHNVQKQLQPSE